MPDQAVIAVYCRLVAWLQPFLPAVFRGAEAQSCPERDCVQPAGQRRSVAQRSSLADQDQEGSLEGVLDLLGVAQQSPADSKNEWPMPPEQHLERRLVALIEPALQQLSVGQRADAAGLQRMPEITEQRRKWSIHDGGPRRECSSSANIEMRAGGTLRLFSATRYFVALCQKTLAASAAVASSCSAMRRILPASASAFNTRSRATPWAASRCAASSGSRNSSMP